jgi:hypothetical protein
MIEVLAANNFGDTREGSLAGPIGLLIIVVLAAGTILLIRNMNARLRRLPERFGKIENEDDMSESGNGK